MGKYAEILANPDYGPYIAHPAADMFPLMTEDEFAALAEDIKEHGQQEPIILLMQEGGTKRLLDGRNRYLACKAAGVEPKFIIKFDIDPWTYVVSKNLRRRHLTREQRDAVIAKLREQGHTIREIAAETGTARATVADAVKRVDDVSETGHVGPETRTDSKGRRQPTRKSRAQRKAGGHSPEQQAKADGIKQAKAEVMITAGKQQAEPIEGKLLEGKPLPRLADLEKELTPYGLDGLDRSLVGINVRLTGAVLSGMTEGDLETIRAHLEVVREKITQMLAKVREAEKRQKAEREAA